MGWLKRKIKAAWKATKAALKATWRAVKGFVRQVVRLVATLWGLLVGLPDLLFGFIGWPTKNLRIHVVILRDAAGVPVATAKEVQPSIAWAKDVFKRRFNVELKPYRGWIEVLDAPAPDAALNVHCNWSGEGEEFREAGEYFNNHLIGWNAAPVSLAFPVTIFIVKHIAEKAGCSLGPLTDYVTLEPAALASSADPPSTMAHELGHACNLLGHSFGRSNLMWGPPNRGDTVHWWQKNLVRSSRHVVYW